MRKLSLRSSIACAGVLLLGLSSCKDDSYLTTPVPTTAQSFRETFDVYQEAYDRGWRAINRSVPLGRKYYDVTETPVYGSPNWIATYYPEWNQAQFTLDSLQFGLQTPFPGRYWVDAFASQRASNGYVATSVTSAEFVNLTGPSVNYNVNNWLVSPEITIQNGDKISFYTYCKGIARLQVLVNKTTSLNVGESITAFGDFGIKLLDINPFYKDVDTDSTQAYPQAWTRFECEVTGVDAAVKGRIAFRYMIQDAAPSSATTFDELYNEMHKSVIGIDELTYTSAK